MREQYLVRFTYDANGFHRKSEQTIVVPLKPGQAEKCNHGQAVSDFMAWARARDIQVVSVDCVTYV